MACVKLCDIFYKHKAIKMKKICSFFNSKLSLMKLSGLTSKATMLGFLFLSFFSINDVKANHGQAAISDIDHIGMGTFSGNYTHSTADHVWIVFNANAGNVITFNLSTGFTHHYWLYRAVNGCVQVGNSTANGCLVLVQNGGNGATNGTYTFAVTTTGQYAFQLDSFLGGSGAYSVTVSGSTATTLLCTPAAPAFTTCPSNITTSLTSGCSMPVSYTAVASFGNLSFSKSGATTGSGTGTGSGTAFNVGTTNVTVTATNTCGAASSATCSFTVTVLDNLAPNALCKPATVYLDANGNASVSTADINNGSNDNCGAVTLGFSPSGTICNTVPEHGTLTMTAPSGSVFAQIIFASYGTPNGSCGSFTLGSCHATNSASIVSGYALGNNSFSIPAENGIFGDPCFGTFKRLYVQAKYGPSSSTVNFNCSQTGPNNVTLYVTDASGNISSCTSVVTVVDNISPTITCPAPITIQCDAPVPDPDINTVIVSDNCNAGITVTWEGDQVTPGNCPSNFIITRTYQAKDASNNVAICTQTIMVIDNTPPTLTVPANVTLQCTDPLPLMPLNINSSPNFIDGTYNVGTAVFGAPLTSAPLTADAVMVIDDAGNPYDACENITNDLTGKIAVIERSGCTPPTSFFVNKAFKAQQAGAVGVIFIFNQPGNFVATMGLPPGPNPTITIPLMLVSNNYGNTLKAEILAGAVNVSLSAPTVIANDACSFASITHHQTFTPGNCPSNYTLLNTWTATDQCGNATSASQTITVIDNTAPTLTVPANVTLQCSDPLPLMPLNINSSPNFIDGTYNVGTAVFGAPLTATPLTADAVMVIDDAGNPYDACENITNNLTGKIAVIERSGCTPPTSFFVNKAYKAQLAGAVGVIFIFNQPGNNVATMGLPPGPNPTITIPLMLVSNNYGNTLKAEILAGAVNVSLSAPTVIANDACSFASITHQQTFTPGNCPSNYTLVNTWTATDQCGNATSASQTITVIDNTPPTITVPVNVTMQCSDPLPLKPLNINNSPNNMDGTYNLGTAVFGPALTTTPVTGNLVLVNDGVGNPADACQSITNSLAGKIAVIDRGTCLFVDKVFNAQNMGAIAVIVVNNQPGDGILTMGAPASPPVITIPSIFVSNNYGNALKASMALGNVNASLSASPVNATDNCSGVIITYTKVITPGVCTNSYSILNTWTATDACNNAVSASQTITVIDNTKPVITCPSNITVNNTTGQCGANVSFAATATDNCSTPVITYSKNPGTFFAVGTTLVTATATDACNNSIQCSFNVTVNDNEKPIISVQNIARCFADDNFGCSINLGATATDNCQVVSLTSNAPACFPVGTTTVTWTATDNHGNVSTATQTVTRNPEINIDICAGPTRTIYRGTVGSVGPFGPQSVNLTTTVTGGTPGYTYSWSPAAGLSNSGIANPVANPAVTTIYTLTVTDSKGCQRSLSITVNVLPLSSAVCSGSGNNLKFLVCHIPPGNPSNPQNICISVNALNAHLTSGSNGHNNCYLGPCQQNCFSTIPGAASLMTRTQTVEEEVVVIETPIVEVQQPDFKVNVYPNPTAYDFSIQVMSKTNEPITVRILDLNGKVMSVGKAFSKGNNIKVGANLLGGTYIAEVIQGSNKQVVKLVKLN
jgi:hypothetical protein